MPTDAPQSSMSVQGVGESQAGRNLAQVSTPVPTNVFKGTLQINPESTTAYVMVLVEDGYNT